MAWPLLVAFTFFFGAVLGSIYSIEFLALFESLRSRAVSAYGPLLLSARSIILVHTLEYYCSILRSYCLLLDTLSPFVGSFKCFIVDVMRGVPVEYRRIVWHMRRLIWDEIYTTEDLAILLIIQIIVYALPWLYARWLWRSSPSLGNTNASLPAFVQQRNRIACLHATTFVMIRVAMLRISPPQGALIGNTVMHAGSLLYWAHDLHHRLVLLENEITNAWRLDVSSPSTSQPVRTRTFHEALSSVKRRTIDFICRMGIIVTSPSAYAFRIFSNACFITRVITSPLRLAFLLATQVYALVCSRVVSFSSAVAHTASSITSNLVYTGFHVRRSTVAVLSCITSIVTSPMRLAIFIFDKLCYSTVSLTTAAHLKLAGITYFLSAELSTTRRYFGRSICELATFVGTAVNILLDLLLEDFMLIINPAERLLMTTAATMKCAIDFIPLLLLICALIIPVATGLLIVLIDFAEQTLLDLILDVADHRVMVTAALECAFKASKKYLTELMEGISPFADVCTRWDASYDENAEYYNRIDRPNEIPVGPFDHSRLPPNPRSKAPVLYFPNPTPPASPTPFGNIARQRTLIESVQAGPPMNGGGIAARRRRAGLSSWHPLDLRAEQTRGSP